MNNLFPAASARPARPLAALALLLAASAAAQGQTPASFAAVRTYPTGANSSPQGVAVADVDGDGQLDIITANNGNSMAGVLLGRAGGGFAAVSQYPTGTGSGPGGIAVADVNGDGRLDIVTANSGSHSVGVLLGRASGGFAPVNSYPTGVGGPSGVAVADVNGDGRPDIVTANLSSHTAEVLLGQAGGGFAAVSTYPTGAAGSYPQSIAVADVNGDGRPDLVTANFGTSTAGVLLGQAGGGFAAFSAYPIGAGSGAQGVAVADVNGDGRLDLVTANRSNSTAGVLLGQASGGFAAASTYAIGANSVPFGIAVADVNGDGRPDLVTANGGSDTAGALLGMAGGGFAAASAYATGVGSQPFGVAVADVNGDGRPDIVTANAGSHSVGVLLNTGTYAPLAAFPTAAADGGALFPNPARDSFALRLPAAWGPAPALAELRNARGQVVVARAFREAAGGATLDFATKGLAPGVYVLRVQAGGHALVRRVVVE